MNLKLLCLVMFFVVHVAHGFSEDDRFEFIKENFTASRRDDSVDKGPNYDKNQKLEGYISLVRHHINPASKSLREVWNNAIKSKEHLKILVDMLKLLFSHLKNKKDSITFAINNIDYIEFIQDAIDCLDLDVPLTHLNINSEYEFKKFCLETEIDIVDKDGDKKKNGNKKKKENKKKKTIDKISLARSLLIWAPYNLFIGPERINDPKDKYDYAAFAVYPYTQTIEPTQNTRNALTPNTPNARRRIIQDIAIASTSSADPNEISSLQNAINQYRMSLDQQQDFMSALVSLSYDTVSEVFQFVLEKYSKGINFVFQHMELKNLIENYVRHRDVRNLTRISELNTNLLHDFPDPLPFKRDDWIPVEKSGGLVFSPRNRFANNILDDGMSQTRDDPDIYKIIPGLKNYVEMMVEDYYDKHMQDMIGLEVNSKTFVKPKQIERNLWYTSDTFVNRATHSIGVGLGEVGSYSITWIILKLFRRFSNDNKSSGCIMPDESNKNLMRKDELRRKRHINYGNTGTDVISKLDQYYRAFLISKEVLKNMQQSPDYEYISINSVYQIIVDDKPIENKQVKKSFNYVCKPICRFWLFRWAC